MLSVYIGSFVTRPRAQKPRDASVADSSARPRASADGCFSRVSSPSPPRARSRGLEAGSPGRDEDDDELPVPGPSWPLGLLVLLLARFVFGRRRHRPLVSLSLSAEALLLRPYYSPRI